MSNYCKYYKQIKQISSDYGQHWSDTSEYRQGDLYEYGSSDCSSPTPPIPVLYERHYLTFVAETTSSIIFSGGTGLSGSTDGGVTWFDMGTSAVTLSAGERLMVKRVREQNTSGLYGFGNSTGTYHVEGNPLSLVFGDDFKNGAGVKTDLTNYQYALGYMFNGCSGLTNIDNLVLPATTLADSCYASMFRGCTSLTTVPSNMLPATTLADNCYESMFSGCTSLTTVPVLSATTLAEWCYFRMFSNCTNLTTAPALLVTTLKNYCYREMLTKCTSLTTAPELQATALVEGCYWGMFRGCTNLNYIKCLATDIDAYDCTYQWVYGVSNSGTFTKAANMSSWPRGSAGIPNNWTVIDAT